MSKDKLRLICKCGTIYDVCDMPIDVDDVIKAINASKCPSCNKSSKTACVYVGGTNEREER